jgi:hypothetical protein
MKGEIRRVNEEERRERIIEEEEIMRGEWKLESELEERGL